MGDDDNTFINDMLKAVSDEGERVRQMQMMAGIGSDRYTKQASQYMKDMWGNAATSSRSEESKRALEEDRKKEEKAKEKDQDIKELEAQNYRIERAIKRLIKRYDEAKKEQHFL